MSSRIKRKQIDLTLSDGPTDGIYGTTNSPGVVNADTMENAFDKVITILDALAPGRPPKISEVPFNFSFRSGYQTGLATQGPLLTNITDVAGPTFISDESTSNVTGTAPIPNLFQDGAVGYLTIAEEPTAEVNIVAATANTASKTAATALGRVITLRENRDYWQGVPGRAGFWRAISASFKDYSHVASTQEYSFTGQHTLATGGISTNGQKVFRYHQESAAAPSATNLVLGAPATTWSNRFVSGVPTLATTDQVNLRLDILNVSRKYYKNQPISLATNAFSQSAPWNWPSVPATDALTTTISHVVTPTPNTFVENVTLSFTASDVIGASSTASLAQAAQLRVDTVSSTAADFNRVVSGGLFDKGLVDAYQHNQSIVSNGNYSNELQLENGKYVYPTKNYTNFYPALENPAFARNYSGQSGLRMATWKVGTVSDCNKITISTLGLNNILGDAGFKVLLLVGQSSTNSWQTPWLDASLAYDDSTAAKQALLNNPLADGTGALEIGTATSTARKVVVKASGTLPSGTYEVFVRVVWDSSKGFNLAGKPTLVNTNGTGAFTAA